MGAILDAVAAAQESGGRVCLLYRGVLFMRYEALMAWFGCFAADGISSEWVMDPQADQLWLAKFDDEGVLVTWEDYRTGTVPPTAAVSSLSPRSGRAGEWPPVVALPLHQLPRPECTNLTTGRDGLLWRAFRRPITGDIYGRDDYDDRYLRWDHQQRAWFTYLIGAAEEWRLDPTSRVPDDAMMGNGAVEVTEAEYKGGLVRRRDD